VREQKNNTRRQVYCSDKEIVSLEQRWRVLNKERRQGGDADSSKQVTGGIGKTRRTRRAEDEANPQRIGHGAFIVRWLFRARGVSRGGALVVAVGLIFYFKMFV
jgi:hypothetical protein